MDTKKEAKVEPEAKLEPAAPVPVAAAREVVLECAVCHNTDSVGGVLSRAYYPGSCGHCGGAFRVTER